MLETKKNKGMHEDLEDQLNRPVPRHVMRHMHDTGALRGFARRPWPRYADAGPGWPVC